MKRSAKSRTVLLFPVIVIAIVNIAFAAPPVSHFDYVLSDGTNFWVMVGALTNLIFSTTSMDRAAKATTNDGCVSQITGCGGSYGNLFFNDGDGTGSWGAPNRLPITEASGSYTALVTDCVIICKPTASQTIALGAVASNTNRWYRFKNVTTNTVTIDGNGAETIDGAATLVINTQYQSKDIICDGDEWHVF